MIKTFDYQRTLALIEEDVMSAVQRVLRSGQLILGAETTAFEEEFAKFVGAKYCIGVHSGTTAIHLVLSALGIGYGDEVITVANTCTPTVSAIELTGARAVLVDANPDDLMISPECIKAAITPRTRCIIPVHLWGQAVDIDAIQAIAQDAGISFVEDCAQAHGTIYRGRHVGTFGVAGCFSFYPTKNLGAYGDAGAIVTNDDQLAERLRLNRMYGYTRTNYAETKGMNARISEMQSAILRVKLTYLATWIAARRANAAFYSQHLNNVAIRIPHLHPEREHSYHQYVIRCENRQQIIALLEQNNIGYGIHYDTPIHQMPAYDDSHYRRHALSVSEVACTEILSLPIHEALTDAELETVVSVLNQ